MDLAGQIPKGQNFLVESISIEFFPGVAIDDSVQSEFAQDVQRVASSGVLEFRVGSKLYKNEGPLGIYPPNYHQIGYSALSDTSVTTLTSYLYASNTGKEHEIVPVKLTSNQNFSVNLAWSVVQTISADARIGVRLNGRLFRNAQ